MLIYKYTPHNKCCKYNIIRHCELWFAEFSSLNDPLDLNLAFRQQSGQTLLDSGNYNKASEALANSMKLIDRACQLGSKEACSSLDRINGEKK